MKRIVMYIAAMLALSFAPVKGADIGKLHPVEAVLIYKEDNEVHLKTDTADTGKGRTAEEALEDLKLTTPGTIYLDTAEYLLIGENVESDVEQLRPYLKAKVKVCNVSEQIDPVDAAKYLAAHSNLPQLKEWKQGRELPSLISTGKSLKLS